MQKFKNIEFLRVIGCLAIVLLHLFNKARLFGLFPDIDLYRHFMSMTSSGQKAVDLFFIISGFFFVYKLDVTQSLWNFIKKKMRDNSIQNQVNGVLETAHAISSILVMMKIIINNRVIPQNVQGEDFGQ